MPLPDDLLVEVDSVETFDRAHLDVGPVDAAQVLDRETALWPQVHQDDPPDLFRQEAHLPLRSAIPMLAGRTEKLREFEPRVRDKPFLAQKAFLVDDSTMSATDG